MRDENPRTRPRPWTALAAALAVLPAALACDDSFASGRRAVRIGLLLPESVEQGWAGEVWRGLRLGIGDWPVEFVRRDHGGDPALAAQMVLDLADSEVSVIVGPLFSTSCLAAAERAESLRVPLITPSGTHQDITAGRDYVFRTCFSNLQQAERMAVFAMHRLALERFAILKDVTNEYSLGLAEKFAETVLMRDGVLTGEHVYRQGRIDGESLRDWLAAQEDCQAVYVPGYSEDVMRVLLETEDIWKERKLVFLGGDGWDVIRLVGEKEALPDCYYTTHFAVSQDRSADDFTLSEFMASFAGQESSTVAGGDGIPPSTTALGYDTGVLLRRVFATGPVTRDEVRNALRRELARFRGVTGAFEMRGGGLAKQIHVMHVSSEGWEPRCRCEGH